MQDGYYSMTEVALRNYLLVGLIWSGVMIFFGRSIIKRMRLGGAGHKEINFAATVVMAFAVFSPLLWGPIAVTLILWLMVGAITPSEIATSMKKLWKETE